MLTALVIVVVSGALLVGALWGAYGHLPDRLEGFIVSLAGGALLLSAVLELIEPATNSVSTWWVSGVVVAGASVFALADYAVDIRWGSDSGGGLLAAITLDGVPENLALGVALISTGPLGAAALSGSILLSNLPEAAGGAKQMVGDGRSRRSVLLLWGATALVLSLAALAGNVLLAGVPTDALALIRAFAGGAVVASLATEVFPPAFRKDGYPAAIATSLGLVMALALSELSR